MAANSFFNQKIQTMQRRYRKPKPKKESFKHFRINERIRAPQIFLIDAEGNKIGLTNTLQALEKARAAELDLVEVSPLAKPPVAKIMDYGQHKYETEKKMRKSKAHQKIAELKSIRLSFRIKGRDLETKQSQALKFLNDGNKVKINIILKGREKAHKNMALQNMQEFINSLGENVKIVQPVIGQGGQITATVTKA
jgi:translation initiation factor IF-3